MRPLPAIGLVLLVAPLGAYVVERLVVTDEEAVEREVHRAVAAVEHEDFEALAESIDPDYLDDEERNRDDVVAYLRTQWRTWRPQRLRADVLSVAFEGEEAVVRVRLRARVIQRTEVTVGARLVRRPEGWRIAKAWRDTGGSGGAVERRSPAGR